MSSITHLIQTKTEYWIREELKKSQSVAGALVKHIDKGKLREPQKEAIKTYLWLKFIGNNQKLSQIVRDGLLYEEEQAKEFEFFHTFGQNYTTQFLNQFCHENKLKNLHKRLINDPHGERTDWNKVLDQLLHDYEYPSYLYSLPMGAGKTYLMACFIYLDLYLASLYKLDKRFAHNFVVFAPQATKTAILPSLQTIKNFNPEWVLPKDEADRIKQIVQIEILDTLSSKRKDKLQGNNPNLEKVNRITQTKNFGLVFITNAEKVVLERYSDDDKLIKDKNSLLYDEKKALETVKYNDLREKLSQIPYLSVILDEVHHIYGTNENGEKKLRQAVNVLNQHGHVISIIGMSGTPYVTTSITVGDELIKLNQIQDIVYNYSLNQGIGRFLKIPEVRKSEVRENEFIKEALSDFFSEFDFTYTGGTKSKIAFYCPSIKKLNQEILPVIQEWYQKNRPGKELEIFRFYSDVGKDEKDFAVPKESPAIFNNLDKPYSDKRVVLLVAIGAEGWDCKSLTAVALPRKETSKNFVLQTTCRCLREVDNASQEKALIYLGDGNYEILDHQLKENYHLSVSDLKQSVNELMPVAIRKPNLGKLRYKQISTEYKIIKRVKKELGDALSSFDFSKIKNKFKYDTNLTKARISEQSLSSEVRVDKKVKPDQWDYTYTDFIYDIARESYGRFTEKELFNHYGTELKQIFQKLEKESSWINGNPDLSVEAIVKLLVSTLMDEVEYETETIETDTEIELLEWQIDKPMMSLYSQSGVLNKFMPRITSESARRHQRHPDDMEVDFFSTDPSGRNIDPQNISYNYAPYKMDSDFERNALDEMVKASELSGSDVYFNGYKDGSLESFWIQTPVGVYTPDFLVLKKKGKEIVKVLIIETKGKSYYDDDFKRKERFMKEVFVRYNPQFRYECFVDEGKNDFSIHMDKFKEMVKSM